MRLGDTLSAIALRNRIELAELRRINGLRGDRIRAGQTLRLRPVAARIRTANSGTLVVRSGDTLSQIAATYHTAVSQLRRIIITWSQSSREMLWHPA